MTKMVVTPEEVLKAQESASTTCLVICVAVVFLHGMMCGASLGYGGLVLPHHLDSASAGLLHLEQGQASWFNSVTPVGMCLGVLASIPASERLGRKKMFLVSNLISSVGFVSLYMAPSYLVLVAFRIAQCFGLGLGGTTTAVYLTEVNIVNIILSVRWGSSGCVVQ